jgi:hypothetical protein
VARRVGNRGESKGIDRSGKASRCFPKFLQDHLFDGIAPAVLVDFLIYRFRLEEPNVAEAMHTLRSDGPMTITLGELPGQLGMTARPRSVAYAASFWRSFMRPR